MRPEGGRVVQYTPSDTIPKVHLISETKRVQHNLLWLKRVCRFSIHTTTDCMNGEYHLRPKKNSFCSEKCISLVGRYSVWLTRVHRLSIHTNGKHYS